MNAIWNTPHYEEEPADNGDDGSFNWGGRDGLIFLIDASADMFEKTYFGGQPIGMVIECCKTSLLNKIVGSDKDLMGIVFFATEKKENPLDLDHCYVLQELLQPSAEIIKELENILADLTILKKKLGGHSTKHKLSNVFWLCQTLFARSKLKLISQRIILFTLNDNPHADSPQDQYQARVKAKDLCQLKIDVELIYMRNNFDSSLFYQEFLQIVKGEGNDWILPDPPGKIEELLTRVLRREHKKRSTGRIMFTLGPDVKIGIGIYNLIRKTPMPKKVNLNRATNEPLQTRQQLFDHETAEVLSPSDICKFQQFGERKIKFAQDEIKRVQGAFKPGLELMGFKPASSVKVSTHVQPSSFIYPEEQLVKGSTMLFAALLDRCITRQVVPICYLTSRQYSKPNLVALVPQSEVIDECRVQTSPPGFHVVYLPYADNFRNLQLQETKPATPEQIDIAQKLISRLKILYSPFNFDNPKLQNHWANIEALALERDKRDDVEDHTVPDYERMTKRICTYAEEFLEAVCVESSERFEYTKEPKKRPASQASFEEKKQKKNNVDITDAEVQELINKKKVESLKVDQLKKYLEKHGVKGLNKKKAELVEMMYSL